MQACLREYPLGWCWEEVVMMKRSIVGLDSERFKHGGKHAKIGWHATKRTGNRSSMTSRSCWRHYLTRKQLHSQKWMHSWRIALRGGRLERVHTNSSVDVCQTFLTYLSTQERILTWRTSNNGRHGEVLRGEVLRGGRTFEGLRGAFVSLVSPSSFFFLVVLPCLGVFWCVVVVCWVFVLFVLAFASSPAKVSISHYHFQ